MDENSQEEGASQKIALTFPCDMPMKVIGINSCEFEPAVKEIINRHQLDVAEEDITSTLSKKETYRSISFHFMACSREQVDALYIELTANSLVKWVL
ncbi:MAG: YbeD family protein [Flexilinea sp.]